MKSSSRCASVVVSSTRRPSRLASIAPRSNVRSAKRSTSAGSASTERRRSAPPGLAGGADGKPGENWLLPAGDESRATQLGDKLTLECAAGDVLRILTPGVGGELQLTDAIRALLKFEKVYGYTYEGKRHDAGDKLGFLKATVEFALKRDDLGPRFREWLKSQRF